MATTPTTYKPEEIKSYVTDQGWVDATGAVTNPYAVYGEAQKYGVSADQLDSAMGWNAGTTANWTAQQGYNPLTGTTSPAPAPTPTPAVTPTPAIPAISGGTTMTSGSTSASNPAQTEMLNGWHDSYMQQGNQAVGSAQSAAANVPTSSYQQGTSTQGQAAQAQWDESMSAAGRLNSMLDANGALMQSAALRGKQAAARMGLGSSTMAAEAMQKAMIDSATPFATTDAQLYNQQQLANMSEANKWDTLDLDRLQNDRQYAAQMGLEYDKLQQNAQQFADKMGLDWAGLQQNERLEVMKLAQQESQFSRSQGQELTIAGMQFAMDDKRLSQQDKQFMQQLGMDQQRIDAQISQFEKQFGMDRDKMSQQDRQFYDGLQLEKTKIDNQATQFQTEWENRFSLATMEKDGKIELAKMDADNRVALAGIEAEYRKDIASNENISQAWGTMVSQIGQIQNNPELEGPAKAAAIQNVMNSFQSFTTFWKKIEGGTIDVSDLLNFGVQNSAPAAAPAATAANPAAPVLADMP